METKGEQIQKMMQGTADAASPKMPKVAAALRMAAPVVGVAV